MFTTIEGGKTNHQRPLDRPSEFKGIQSLGEISIFQEDAQGDDAIRILTAVPEKRLPTKFRDGVREWTVYEGGADVETYVSISADRPSDLIRFLNRVRDVRAAHAEE